MAGMDDLIRALDQDVVREVPEFNTGDIIRVYEHVSEGARERLQPFEGVVLKQSGSGSRKTVTIRKIAAGIGVERTFPLHHKLERIEVLKRNNVRQARPYWLRRISRLHKIG